MGAETTNDERAATSFPVTRWSVILSSGSRDADDNAAHRALAEVCRIYWRPVFACLCREGCSSEDAQDLTQEFFRMILSTGWLQKADRSRGRFRNLLRHSLRNFLRDHARKRGAIRRGGGEPAFISWDDSIGEAPSQVRFSARAVAAMPAEQLFDMRWAVTVAEQALHHLAEECERKGRRRLFDTLSQYLTADSDLRYSVIAQQLGLSEAEFKRQLHVMRLRYRSLLREAVGQTVQSRAEIDDEIRHLCAALACEPLHQ